MALLIALFLPWYTRDADVAGALLSSSWTAWESVPATAAVLFGVAAAAVGLSAARAVGVSLGGLRVDRVVSALGLLALVLVGWRLAVVPIGDLAAEPGDRVDDGRGAGLVLALVAAAAVAYGGRVSRR